MKIPTQGIVKTGLLAALAIALQMMHLPQPVTGPGVNAVLLITAVLVGPFAAALVGVLTPWVAMLSGIMPLAAALPVVIAGNVTLALTAGYLCRVNRYAGFGVAALVKFTVMSIGVKVLVSRGTNIPTAAFAALSTTQLVTALAGGVVALAVLAALQRANIQKVSKSS